MAVFREFAILDEGAAAIRFAPAVFDLDRPALAAVLRGLFTADATVANYGEQSRYVSLDSTSLELLRQTQLLLLAFGIKARLYEDTRLAEATAARPHPTHSLRISRASCPLFEQAIGFHAESPKAQALARLNGDEPVAGEELTDEVLAIEPAGEADVFDLTEDGHPPLRGGRARRAQLLGVPLPRRHRVQPRVHQPGEVPPRGRQLRRGRLPPRLPPVDLGARDQRADGGLPEPGDRPAELGLPHPRPGLRQHGHRAHAPGHPLRFPGGDRHLRRDDRDHVRRGLRDLGGDGAGPRALPRLPEEPRATCCA